MQQYISYGHKRQIDKASGQNELFSANVTHQSPNIESKMKINKISPSLNDLIKERKVLGYYLSSHPMETYKKEIADMKLKNLLEINNLILNNSATKFNSTISGVIIDSRSQKIGKNKFITIYKVDDGSQQINVSFFEDMYLKYKNILKEDVILFFNGEVYIDDYDSQLSMKAEKIYSLDDAREKYSKYLNITLSSDIISKEKIYNIKKIIDKHDSGKTKVLLSYKTRDIIAPINSDKDIYVKITDNLISDIKSIVGEESVAIKYQ